jgi:hypothetical protein
MMSNLTIYRAIWTDIEDNLPAVFPSTSPAWRGTLPEGLLSSVLLVTWDGMRRLLERELQRRSGDLL